MMYVYIALAGFIGASLRFLTGELLFDENATFPYATLTINITGTFLLAWFTYAVVSWSSQMKKAIGSGLLGSFTTFSALSVETIDMMGNGEMALAVLYIMLSFVGGLIAAATGMRLAETGRAS